MNMQIRNNTGAPTRLSPSQQMRLQLDICQSQFDLWRGELRALPECPKPGASSCAGLDSCRCSETVDGILAGAVEFMNEHFTRENTLMRRGVGMRGLRELFELHAEDHGMIMSSLVKAMELPTPCRQRRALTTLFDQHLQRHFVTHDSLLREELPRLHYRAQA